VGKLALAVAALATLPEVAAAQPPAGPPVWVLADARLRFLTWHCQRKTVKFETKDLIDRLLSADQMRVLLVPQNVPDGDKVWLWYIDVVATTANPLPVVRKDYVILRFYAENKVLPAAEEVIARVARAGGAITDKDRNLLAAAAADVAKISNPDAQQLVRLTFAARLTEGVPNVAVLDPTGKSAVGLMVKEYRDGVEQDARRRLAQMGAVPKERPRAGQPFLFGPADRDPVAVLAAVDQAKPDFTFEVGGVKYAAVWDRGTLAVVRTRDDWVWPAGGRIDLDPDSKKWFTPGARPTVGDLMSPGRGLGPDPIRDPGR
jgi:hypothetical protein